MPSTCLWINLRISQPDATSFNIFLCETIDCTFSKIASKIINGHIRLRTHQHHPNHKLSLKNPIK